VSKVNSENNEYQSCLPCLGNICRCPERVSLSTKKSSEKGGINFSVSNKITVEVNTQNEKQGANKADNTHET
jgi:hypothetical protein